MSVAALIKYAQGMLTPPGGQALIGLMGVPATAANDNNANVKSWEWEWFATPTTSAISVGIVTSGQVPILNWTPDVRGTYVLVLRVYDAQGNVSQDMRCFSVREATGSLIPNFGADGASANYGGQTRGWHPYVEALLKKADAGGGGGGSEGAAGEIQTSDGAGGFVGADSVIAGDGFVSVGPAPAKVGAIRLPNAGEIVARNVDDVDGHDLCIAVITAANRLYLGIDAAFGKQVGSIFGFAINDVTFGLGSTTYLTCASGFVTCAKPLQAPNLSSGGTTNDPAPGYVTSAGEVVAHSVATVGQTDKLKAAPVDSDTITVLNASGGAIIVDVNGGPNIYTALGPVATQALADAETAVYRYVALVTNWMRLS